MKSNTLYLVEAIREFLPDSEFSFTNDDYATIEFSKIAGNPPSKKQITDKVDELKKRDQQLLLDAETKKQAILQTLNLSEEEFKSIFAL